MKIETQKPELKYEDGMLIAKAGVGIDKDQDGKMSVGLEAKMFIDGAEALNEIFKDGIPEWALKIIGVKASSSNLAQIQSANPSAELA